MALETPAVLINRNANTRLRAVRPTPESPTSSEKRSEQGRETFRAEKEKKGRDPGDTQGKCTHLRFGQRGSPVDRAVGQPSTMELEEEDAVDRADGVHHQLQRCLRTLALKRSHLPLGYELLHAGGKFPLDVRPGLSSLSRSRPTPSAHTQCVLRWTVRWCKASPRVPRASIFKTPGFSARARTFRRQKRPCRLA